MHGTRFINHQRNGLEVLLVNWVLLIQAMENELATPGCDAPKLRGFLKKLTDARMLTASVLLKQLLDIAATASLKLEKQSLFIFDVAYIVEMCMADITSLEMTLLNEHFEIDGELEDEQVLELSLCNYRQPSQTDVPRREQRGPT